MKNRYANLLKTGELRGSKNCETGRPTGVPQKLSTKGLESHIHRTNWTNAEKAGIFSKADLLDLERSYNRKRQDLKRHGEK